MISRCEMFWLARFWRTDSVTGVTERPFRELLVAEISSNSCMIQDRSRGSSFLAASQLIERMKVPGRDYFPPFISVGPGLKPRSLCFLILFGLNLRAGWMDGPSMEKCAVFMETKQQPFVCQETATWTCRNLLLQIGTWGSMTDLTDTQHIDAYMYVYIYIYMYILDS